MILGGSELLETAAANSDLDIIFLIHQIYEKDKESFKECKMCLIKRDSSRPCIEEHDLIFGNSKLSLYSHLKKAIVNGKTIERLKLKENEANINLVENSRVPLLAIEIQSVEMDVMIANIPDSKIDDSLELTKHDDIENIKGNLNFIDGKINSMIKLKDPLYIQSILILSGYRIAYRTKFFMLDKNKWEIFSDLMRAVKHWAKQKGLYSNVFGYLSGTALILMTAKICLIYQSASLTFLVQRFFQIYSLWEWPVPIILEQLTMSSDLPQLSNNDFIKSWNLLNLRNDYMPIISPIFPEQNTAFNTNEFTRDIIVKEMKKAYAQLDRSTSLLTEKFYKDILFKKLEYKKQYEHFLVLVCSEKIKIEDINENKSCEFVKTKVRGLLVKWAKKATLRFKIEENITENVEEENYKIYKLSDYLEEYHVLTNLEWKCNDGE
ncbi:unnamed protein product [Meloidogyne enterolobii]|uniref:Uncharacterized protein n=1 Tax=Meloidogyne enterolobii TaxID=390850 RepID=A0ACB0Z0U2_MELEN